MRCRCSALRVPRVDADITPDHHIILGGAPRGQSGISGRTPGLGRCAAGIDASAADKMALDDSRLHPGAGQAERQGWSGLAAADDDRVEIRHDKPLQQLRYSPPWDDEEPR